MAASEFGHLGVVKLLIEYGADVSFKYTFSFYILTILFQ
jgi:ankyrin repeat protein